MLGRELLSREILGPLLGEFALEQSRGLADLDQVAVGVPHVAANLGTAIDRRRHELGPSGFPLLVARLDIGDAQVHEGGERVVELVVDDRDVRLVRGGATARVHDHPGVGELDHARVLLQHHLAAENLGVEGTGPSNASHGDEHRDDEALARRGQVLVVDVWRVLGHGSSLPKLRSGSELRWS